MALGMFYTCSRRTFAVRFTAKECEMENLRMSVGRDYATSSRYEYVIFRNERIVARQGGFSRSNQARAAGFRKAEELQA